MKKIKLLRRTLLVIATCISLQNYAQQKDNSILNKKINQLLCFNTANKELEKIAQLLKVTINFNQERLQEYTITKDFHNDNLARILRYICKATDSKYFVAPNDVIYIIGKKEKYSAEVAAAVKQATEYVEPGRAVQETPEKFNITVSGKVIDKNTGEPLSNATIAIKDNKGNTNTNVDGYFTLFEVPNDTMVLELSALGYTPARFFLSPKQTTDSLQIQMTTVKSSQTDVLVTSRKPQSFKLNQKVSMIKLTPDLISTLPSLGEKDIFRSFQLMPGVSAANENTSGLYVRGGTPDQSLVLFDGFTVYNVEHLFGFFSAFNSNAIKDVALYKGGFESKYGGRLSSVMDINSKEGNKKAFNAGADLSLMSANIFGEGPLGKNVTGIINARKSFRTSLYDKIFDKYSTTTAPQATNTQGRFGNSNQKTRSYFYDVNGRFTWKPNTKDIFSLSIYNGQDNLDNSIIPEIPAFLRNTIGNLSIKVNDVTNWGNTGGSLKWSRKWNKKVFSNTLISSSNYFSERDRTTDINSKDADGKDVNVKRGTLEDNDLKDYSIKTDVEVKPNKTHTIETGYHITYNSIKYSYAQNDTSKIIDRDTKGLTYTIYAQDKLTLLNNNLQLIPGMRVSYFDQTKKMYYEPRLNATYELTNKIKLKGSYGQYYQFAKRVIREDVLQGSRDFWVLADKNKLPVSSSAQVVAGASWENNDYLIDIEAYHKKLKGLSEYSLRFQLNPQQLSYEENFFQGSGYARGIDFLVQKKFGNYNGWIGYTLGEAVQNYDVYGPKDFYASNDVRHEFKTVHMLKVKKFDFSATFIYASGKPYTAPSGAYTVTLLDGTTQNYFTVTDKNSVRLPDYHRLDVGVTYNFGEKGSSNGSIGLSLFNLYNRANVWYKNYEISNNSIIETNVNYLGFTPNITFTYKLK
jgi:ferric enterobactin receptor